ncbi:hypothetical protein E4T56_gene4663 [Termitomyces sp. T112]|nr:hypothetical protein E4T56_gene4663 [Termitomyces sp. T112]
MSPQTQLLHLRYPTLSPLETSTLKSSLQVTPALPEEHLHAGTTVPESKTEEQILSEVVPLEYHEFADVFSEGSAKELPPHRSYNHKINLKEGTSPPFGKIYNMSEIELRALKEYLDDMLGKGFICPLISAADYQGLNKVTKKNRYPLPLIRDLVDRLRSAKIYTKIDLRSGYNNVQIAPGHEWKTTFRTHYGLFEYLVMPFGMTNSPATFQYFMNDIFHDMNDVFVIVYLDNILIYSNSPAEHSEHCSFHTTEVEYLRVIVTPDGVCMDPTKVDAILNWPSPRNIKEDTPWDWDSKCQSVFLLLKKAFTSAPVLRYFDPSLPIVLECDTSDYAIARILSQSDLGGKDLCPVTFYTRSMIPTELNYDIYNKELLAIVKAFSAARLDGPKPSRSTILLFTTAPDDSAQSPMPSLKDPTYIPSHVAHEVAEDLRSLHQFLQDEINTANQAYSKHADACRKPTPNWPPGTLVWLDWRNLKTWRPSIKLDHKRLGPFKVLRKVSTHAYCHDPFPKTPHIVHQTPEPPKGPPTLRRTSAHAHAYFG